MILCLDVGNSQIYGGVFVGESLKISFRYATQQGISSDQIGIFLKSVLRENQLTEQTIYHIAISSVVPYLDYSLRAACIKYFSIDPFFLHTGIKTNLSFNCPNSAEIGADRIANAIAAVQRFPQKDIIVVDFGTATTVCAITEKKEYLGGAILAGLRISMDALQNSAAKLPPVEIVKPQNALGRSTDENIQSGLYYGHLGGIREIIQRICDTTFKSQPLLVGTGGFSTLFANEKFFHTIIPDLVLEGLRLALQLNGRDLT